MIHAINELILQLAASPWVYLVVVAVVYLDAFFPPVPSESVLVGAAAVAVSTGHPNVVLLGAMAALAALAGDTTAYAIGRGIGTTRFRWMRRPAILRSFAWARQGLDTKGAVLILVARYIPIGRIAVNMTAGATGYPLRRFVPLAAVAGASWSTYSIGVGLLAGRWMHDNPLLAIIVAVAIAIVIGLGIDRLTSVLGRRRAAAAAPAGPE
jgi:membrane protein DedA with SNARE-associated domain